MTNVTCHLPLVDLVPLSGDIDHLIERCMGRPMTADEDSMMSCVICNVPFYILGIGRRRHISFLILRRSCLIWHVSPDRSLVDTVVLCICHVPFVMCRLHVASTDKP